MVKNIKPAKVPSAQAKPGQAKSCRPPTGPLQREEQNLTRFERMWLEKIKSSCWSLVIFQQFVLLFLWDFFKRFFCFWTFFQIQYWVGNPAAQKTGLWGINFSFIFMLWKICAVKVWLLPNMKFIILFYSFNIFVMDRFSFSSWLEFQDQIQLVVPITISASKELER